MRHYDELDFSNLRVVSDLKDVYLVLQFFRNNGVGVDALQIYEGLDSDGRRLFDARTVSDPSMTITLEEAVYFDVRRMIGVASLLGEEEKPKESRLFTEDEVMRVVAKFVVCTNDDRFFGGHKSIDQAIDASIDSVRGIIGSVDEYLSSDVKLPKSTPDKSFTKPE